MIVNSVYDEKTGTFTFEYNPTDFRGAISPKVYIVTLTKEELGKISGAKVDTTTNTASVDTNQLQMFSGGKRSTAPRFKPEPKSSIVSAAVWDPNTNYQAEEPIEEPAYKKGMPVTKEILLGNKGIGLDPTTGNVTFILPANEQAETLAGKGGILGPSFAVIVPKDSYIPEKGTAVAYDAVTAQEKLIADLIKSNRVDEFKKVLLDKGFYESAGYQLPQVRSSLAQKGVADSFFRVATNAFLYTYSLQNYQNIIDDTEAFSYDEFANNYKPSFAEDSAYVPSRRDADASVDSAYIEYVGRRATDKEKQAFFAALQREALNNPTRTVPGMGAGPDTTFGGFTQADLSDFANEFALSTPGAEEYGEGFGGYKMFNNVLSSLVNDLENETQFINKPIIGENPNAI